MNCLFVAPKISAVVKFYSNIVKWSASLPEQPQGVNLHFAGEEEFEEKREIISQAKLRLANYPKERLPYHYLKIISFKNQFVTNFQTQNDTQVINFSIMTLMNRFLTYFSRLNLNLVFYIILILFFSLICFKILQIPFAAFQFSLSHSC